MTLVAPSYGELIAYEGFDYADVGRYVRGKTGGIGFAGEWMPIPNQWGFDQWTYQSADGSLSFDGVSTTGNRIRTDASSLSWSLLGRALANPVPADETRTIYFSFVVQPEEDPAPGQWFSASLIGGDSQSIHADSNTAVSVGAPDTGLYGIGNLGGTLDHSSDVPWSDGQTDLLVVKAELVPGIDTFTLYVDPEPGLPEPLTGTVKQDFDLGGLAAIAIHSTAAHSIDELRLGDTFDDVVPLPALPLRAGDADMDCDFDQFDLIQVQRAAKYLTGDAATWGEGDWNGAPGGSVSDMIPPPGDGRFDQLDIIAAITANTYLHRAYCATADFNAMAMPVPEPSAVVLLGFGLTAMMLMRRRR